MQNILLVSVAIFLQQNLANYYSHKYAMDEIKTDMSYGELFVEDLLNFFQQSFEDFYIVIYQT